MFAYAAAVALLLIVGWVVPVLGLWSDTGFALADRELREGRVIAVIGRQTLPAADGDAVIERVAIDLDGRRVEADRLFAVGTADDFALEPGDTVVLYETRAPNGTSYQFADKSRRVPMWILGLGFAAFAVAIGGRQGVLSIAGLAATVIVIWQFILPAILGGLDPLFVCIAGATVIMAITLITGHGGGRTSLVALGATAACLLLAGALASWAVGLASLSGAASEEAGTLVRLAGGVLDMRGLLLGAIIIGAVGVLDDVTTTQAATVFELHEADRTLTRDELFRRSMRVGRDHIAATTNTLLLAYAGASLPLLLLLNGQGLAASVISFEVFATEAVRTLVGSTAIIAAVPVSSLVAAFAVRPDAR